MYPIVRSIFHEYFRIFHRVSIRNSHLIPPEGPALIVSNHPSYFDPILIHLGSPRLIHFMAWDALFEAPIIPPLIRAFGAFPVDTEGVENNFGAFRHALRLLRNGEMVGVFPEGGRTPLDEGIILDSFRQGAIRLAYLTGTPIIPVTLMGPQLVWPRERTLPKWGKIRVQFHEPVQVSKKSLRKVSPQELEELTERVKTPIRDQLKRYHAYMRQKGYELLPPPESDNIIC